VGVVPAELDLFGSDFFRARYPEATPQRVKTVSHSGQVLEANHEKDGEGNFEM
jgi:hypothetical protein